MVKVYTYVSGDLLHIGHLWLTDKYFQSRSAPVAAVMLLFLGLFA